MVEKFKKHLWIVIKYITRLGNGGNFIKYLSLVSEVPNNAKRIELALIKN
jgi:hypothetical protein